MSSRARETTVNAFAGLLSTAGAQAGVLAAQPFLLWHLGLESYGVWTLCTAMMRYGRLADVLNAPLTTFVARSRELEDRREIRRVMAAAAVFYLVIFALATGTTAASGPFILPFLNVRDVGHAAHVLTGCVAYMFLLIAIQGLSGLLNGLGRLRLSSLAQSIGQLVFAGTAPLLVSRGMGLDGMLVAAFAQVAVHGALVCAMSRGVLGEPIFANPFGLRWSTLVPMLKVGGWLQISTLSELVGAETDQLLIAHFVGPAGVGLYEIGSKIARVLHVLNFYASSALLPMLASIGSGASRAALAGVVARTSRIVALMQFLLSGFLIAAAPQCIAAYVGRLEDAPLAATVLRILAIAYLFEALTVVPATALRASGQTRYEAIAAATSMVLNIGLTVLLAPILGIVGVLTGTLIGDVGSQSVLITFYHRVRRLRLKHDFLAWFLPLALGWGVVTAAFTIVLAQVGTGLFVVRFAGFALASALAVPYIAAYALAVGLMRVVESGDLAMLARVLPGRVARGLAFLSKTL